MLKISLLQKVEDFWKDPSQKTFNVLHPQSRKGILVIGKENQGQGRINSNNYLNSSSKPSSFDRNRRYHSSLSLHKTNRLVSFPPPGINYSSADLQGLYSQNHNNNKRNNGLVPPPKSVRINNSPRVISRAQSDIKLNARSSGTNGVINNNNNNIGCKEVIRENDEENNSESASVNE